MGEDEWVREAMTDDWMAVEVLMRLRQSKKHKSSPEKRAVVVLPDWGLRQPRSRQILRGNIVPAKKEGDSRRASPTTPLSWSGGTSLSGCATVDGYEESSRPLKHKSGVRSKLIPTNENGGRRARKKKTFAELKEEESLLVKEKIHLKKELAILRTEFEEKSARNVSLRKMKFQSSKEEAIKVGLKKADCDVPNQRNANLVDQSPSVLPKQDSSDERDAVAFSFSAPGSCRLQKEDGVTKADNFFALPDLNLPLEGDLNSEVYVIS